MSVVSNKLSSKFETSNLLESKLSSKFETSSLLESLLETIPFSTHILGIWNLQVNILFIINI
jgi:hypothetical protein